MGRPIQEVKVFGVQDRRSTAQAKLPWIARHSIDGRQRSKSFNAGVATENPGVGDRGARPAAPSHRS